MFRKKQEITGAGFQHGNIENAKTDSPVLLDLRLELTALSE
jgi:hypothetical protein